MFHEYSPTDHIRCGTRVWNIGIIEYLPNTLKVKFLDISPYATYNNSHSWSDEWKNHEVLSSGVDYNPSIVHTLSDYRCLLLYSDAYAYLYTACNQQQVASTQLFGSCSFAVQSCSSQSAGLHMQEQRWRAFKIKRD